VPELRLFISRFIESDTVSAIFSATCECVAILNGFYFIYQLVNDLSGQSLMEIQPPSDCICYPGLQFAKRIGIKQNWACLLGLSMIRLFFLDHFGGKWLYRSSYQWLSHKLGVGLK